MTDTNPPVKLVTCGMDNRLHEINMDGHECKNPRMNEVVYVEAEFEYVRREKVRFIANVSEGMATAHAPAVLGRFARTMNFLLYRGKDLVKHEEPRIVTWQFQYPQSAEEQATYFREGFIGNHNVKGL